MDNQFLPPVENISLQRGFKQFNPEKGGSHLLENANEFDKFPYTCFGYLSFKDKDTKKKKLIGQAVLIGPSHILTSANSIYDFTKQYDSVLSQGELEFYSGIELEIQTKVVQIYCNKEAIKANKSYDQQNFAMGILEKSIGEKYGYLGIITPLQMALFEEIQFKQQPVLVFDSQQTLSGQICDVDDKEMLIQFKNSEGVVVNQIDQEYHSIQEHSYEKNQESIDDEKEEQERDQEQLRMEIVKSNAQATSSQLNNIVFIHDKLFGYAVLSADAQRDGIYYKSQYLSYFHLYQMIFWYQGLEVNQKDQTQKIQEMKYLENKGNMKVEEPAEQENKPLVCLKQLNNQFIFTGNEDSSANFWHLGSMNIGQSVQKEVFEYNFRDSTFNGIADIVSEGYYAVAIVGRYAILLNWLNFELIEAKQFDYDLTCIIKRQQRFKYLVGDAQGQVIYLNLDCNTLQLEEDQEGSLRSRQQKNMHGHQKPIERLCLIPERNQLVVASQDGIRLWDVKSKKLVTNIESEQKKAVTFIGYSKTRLYVAGEDQYLKIYDLSGKQQKQIRFQYPIKCGVFLNSSEIALSDGKNLKIINVVTNAQDYYSIHKNNITHICRINELQFITADTRGSLYKWTLMSNESESSLQYRVSVELSKAAKVNFSDYSPDRVAKFFQSNQSPNTSSFHSQKFLQMKAKIETQRNLANQGIYEGSQKMVGDLYTQENYFLKAKVRNLESKVSAAKGEYSESHRDFINNSSFSKLNASSINNSSTRNLRENSSTITLKTQKAQIKVMEQKLKEQEDLVLKIQGEEQMLRNNAEKKVKQEKKVYMEKNVDDIKKNSQRFESMIPLIQNDIDLLRKQLTFMNEKLSDKQDRIRDRSSSLQKKQSELQQFHNQIQKREQNVQEELNKKREKTKQQQEQDKKEMEQQRQQFNDFIKIDQDLVQEDGDEEDNQGLHDNQFEHISQELDQTIKNSQNFINSQRNLNSSLQQYGGQANIDESNESNLKTSQISSKNRNDEINNSLGSSCVLNNKKITSSTQARNIMKYNREEQSFQNQQDMSQNISNSSRNNNKNQISNIEEEQNSYKYTNRKSSPSNYGNSQIISENNEKLSHRAKIDLKKAADQEGQNIEQAEENLKYSFIEQQFIKLQQQVVQLQQNYEELKQSNYSPSKQQTIIIPQQNQYIRPSEFKPVLRIQQNLQNSNQIYNNTPDSPNQISGALRTNNFIVQNQYTQFQQQQSSNIAQNSPPKPHFGSSVTARSLSPNLIANSSGQIYNQTSQIGNSQNLQLNNSSNFYINNSPQKGYNQQILQKSQIHQSPGQILLLNNSLNQSLCEGITSSNTKQKTTEQPNNKTMQAVQSNSQQKQRPSSSLTLNQQQIESINQSKNANQFNIYKVNSPGVQNISQLNSMLVANTNSMNNPSFQQTDFIQQQKLLLVQQQQQLMQQQNPLQTTQSQSNIQANIEINYENEPNQVAADIQKERKISSRLSKQSILSNNQNVSMEATQVKQLQEENQSLKKKLQEHSQLIQQLQQIMQNQNEENTKQQEIISSEKENFKTQYQQLIQQSNLQEQNIQQISEQIVKQTQYINQLEQEKQTQLFSYNEMAKQFEREKNQMLNQINMKELEIQQKNSEILQFQNSLSQLNITIQQLRQMTTYEEVEKLTKQINVMEKMIEQQKNESKSQKQLLIGQEKAIVDGKRIELEFQQIQLLNQQLQNENGILKSRMQFLEAENKQLNQKMLVIRDEIDGKYQNTILELQKLMQGHANKQINISQSVEHIKQGVLTGLDINALDKLVEISNKKQQLSTTQNLKQSVNYIPISQNQGMQQQNQINQSYQAIRIADQHSSSYEHPKIYQQGKNYSQEQQLVNLESTSSIKTFNPDDQRSVQEIGTTNAQQGRFQSRSVSPLGVNSRGQGFNSSQQKSLRSDRSNKKFDSESIKTFQPEGLEVSRSEDSDSDYLSNMSNLQITNQDQYPFNKKSSLKNNKNPYKNGNKQQVVLVDENDIQQNKKLEEQGMCSQQ